MKCVNLPILLAMCLCLCTGCTATMMSGKMTDGTTYNVHRISIGQKVNARLIAPDGTSLIYDNNGGPLTPEALAAIIEGAIKAAGVAAK